MKKLTAALLFVCVSISLSLPALAADPPVRSLGRVFAKLKAGHETVIAYFGGSITAARGYRVKTFQWFQQSFPQAKLVEINAAIGGTGSDLGDFRCAADVIAKRPDLVFVEFNIDDGKNVPADPKYGGPKGIKQGVGDTSPGPYFPRNHYAMLACGLPAGKHTLRLTVLPDRDKTSTGHRLLIGYFLVAGQK